MSRGTRVRGGPITTKRSPTGLSPAPARLPSRFGSLVPMDLDRSCRAPQPRAPPKGRPVWAEPVSLAATPGLSHLISLPRGTEMFQFPRCPSRGLCIRPPMTTLARRRVAPFGFGWLFARLQLPTHVSPLSASFFGTWPLRHPPSTLLRLASSRNHDGCPSCPTHTQTREFVTSARTNDPPTILELARFGKIEANHIATIAIAHTKRWTRSARGRFRDKVYILVLRLFRCCSPAPDHAGRRLRPRRRRHLRNTISRGHPLILPWHLNRVNPPEPPIFQGPESPARRNIMLTRRRCCHTRSRA